MCGLFLWGPLPFFPLQIVCMMLSLLINLLSLSHQLKQDLLVPAILLLSSSFPIFFMPAFPLNTCLFWIFISDSWGNNQPLENGSSIDACSNCFLCALNHLWWFFSESFIHGDLYLLYCRISVLISVLLVSPTFPNIIFVLCF